MKRVLILLIATLLAAPACATDDDAKARELDKKFFNFNAPSDAENDESHLTDKGCREYKIPKWFVDKYGNLRGVDIVIDIKNNMLSDEILRSNSCSCEQYYPKWDKAISIYEADFKDLNAWAPYGTETYTFLAKFHNHSQSQIIKAREICIKTGAW